MRGKGGDERGKGENRRPCGGSSIKDVHTEGKVVMSKLDQCGHWGAGI